MVKNRMYDKKAHEELRGIWKEFLNVYKLIGKLKKEMEEKWKKKR